jgi:RNA polymerase sigma factor (sigma-70 family)
MIPESKKLWINLYRENREKGWEKFLEKYNQLIITLIRKYVQDYDEAMEVYAFVLEHLKEKDCKKLTSYFQKKRKYNFDVWIVVVSKNCMFDWFRKEKGRKRLLKGIESLPEIDQLIFKYIYQHRYSYNEAYEILKLKHRLDITFEEMYSRAVEIINNLTQKTRWQLFSEWQSILPPLPLESIEKYASKVNTKNPCPKVDHSPEENLIIGDISKIINDSLQKLSIQEKLIIDLHLYRGLTLQEISGILKEKKAWKIRRKFYKALQIIKDSLKEKGIKPADFDIFNH